MDDSCTVTFDGSRGGTYYIPCSHADDFDSSLVYYGDTPFTIWENINHQGKSLYVQPFCTPAYKNSEDLYVYTSPENVVYNNRFNWYRNYDSLIIFCLVLLCAFRAITIFRR